MKPALLLTIVALCLFGVVLHRQWGLFILLENELQQIVRVLLVCLAIWCGTFLCLTLVWRDWLLIGLLLFAVADYFIRYAARPVDSIVLLSGVTLGRGVKLLLSSNGRRKSEDGQHDPEDRKREAESVRELKSAKCELRIYLVGLILLLVLASWWHLDMANNSYRGPRWMGLWNNPNDYGLLMAAGGVLALGLIAERLKAKGERLKTDGDQKSEVRSQESEAGNNAEIRSSEFGVRNGPGFIAAVKSTIRNWQSAILLLAAFMMGVGLAGC